MMRKLVTIPVGDTQAMGTAHLPSASMKREAVVLINAGHVPRNGHGAFAVLLAEHLRVRGWPVLRVDLPGLGDSPGPLPERIETFWLGLKSGDHAGWAADVARWAADSFGVPRVVLGGVCGAAVTAVFAADRSPDAVHSLLLIEPELFTSDPPVEIVRGEGRLEIAGPLGAGKIGSNGPAEPTSTVFARADSHASSESSALRARSFLFRVKKLASELTGPGSAQSLTSSWRWMRLLSRRRKSLPLLNILQRVLIRLPASKNEMPERVNLSLIEAWRRVSSRDVPTLVMTAQGLLWEAYFWRLRAKILGRSDRSVTHVSVPEANHVFSNTAAKKGVLGTVPNWLEGQRW